MKTTIDIADDLLLRAKKLAAQEATTLKSIAEEGLRKVLDDRQRSQKAKPVKPLVFKGGRGLTDEAKRMGWHQMIHSLYEDRER